MAKQPTVSTDSVAQDVLQSFFARWQRLEDEKSAISDDLKELFAEAKGLGFDTKVMRKVFRDKTADQADRDLFEAIYDLYWAAIGGGSGPEPEAADFDEPRARPARAREGWNVDENGEIIEGNEPASSEAQVRSERSGEGGEDAPALSADTQSQPGRSEAPRQIEAGLVAKVEDQSTAAVRDSTEGIAAPQPLNPEAATTPPAAGRSPVDTHPEPGNGEAGASPAPAPEPAAEGTAHNPIPSAVPGNMQNLHNAPGSIRTERTHTEGVERHQFAVWPKYQGRAHADLVDDVRTNGVREPIVMQGRIILDGWARYLAAREAGVSYPVQEYAGDDPLRDIITLNIASRSLNLLERQSIAKKLTKLAPDRADEIGELLDLQQQREAAQ